MAFRFKGVCALITAAASPPSCDITNIDLAHVDAARRAHSCSARSRATTLRGRRSRACLADRKSGCRGLRSLWDHLRCQVNFLTPQPRSPLGKVPGERAVALPGFNSTALFGGNGDISSTARWPPRLRLLGYLALRVVHAERGIGRACSRVTAKSAFALQPVAIFVVAKAGDALGSPHLPLFDPVRARPCGRLCSRIEDACPPVPCRRSSASTVCGRAPLGPSTRIWYR